MNIVSQSMVFTRRKVLNGVTITEKVDCLMSLREFTFILMVSEYWTDELKDFMYDINGFLKRHG